MSIYELVNCASLPVPTLTCRIQKSARSLTGSALNNDQATAHYLAKFAIITSRLPSERSREDITLGKLQ
jgi:hypothetical protein